MRKVSNGQCISNISKKSMLANKKRNIILLIAIALTTVMLTSVFTITSSIIKSMEKATCYQVGTDTHAGFKFLTQSEYDKLATDTQIYDLSYNIIVGDLMNQELYDDYTEIRYSEPLCLKHSFVNLTEGSLPSEYNEIITCTKVLDDFGLSHDIGHIIHLKLTNGFREYEGDFIVCGFYEKPAQTMANQIFVSKEFQEEFAPVWKDKDDYDKYMLNNSYAGSINPEFNFNNSFNISKKMDELKQRHGFDDEINDGINWAYATNSIDFTSVMIVVILFLMITSSGYLIIYNIFLIAVTSDIHYYGLLKTIGTTNRQLKRIILNQARVLSTMAIPVGIIIGYIVAGNIMPLITANLNGVKCEIYPNIFVFILCAVFSWITVRVSCVKPCKVINKISPIEAVRYSDVKIDKQSKNKKTKKVSTASMAFENLKRNKKRTVAVVISMALSILMINVTISIVSSFDEEKYISSFIDSDILITDGSIFNYSLHTNVYDGVSFEAMESLKTIPGIEEAGAVYMLETVQDMKGCAYERLKKEYEEHIDWFIYNIAEKEWYDQLVYEEKRISSHLYGVDKMAFDKMEMETKNIDWEKFKTGKYAIVSAPINSEKDDSQYAFYQVGERIEIELLDGTKKEYEVIGIGDLCNAMGPQHSHGMDIFVTIPAEEYLKIIPDCKGALNICINVEDSNLDNAENFAEYYCDEVEPNLVSKSRKSYLAEFKDTINLFLIIGGALSFILALIGIMNFLNLTYTSIQERKQELKVLWSVGMTKKQISEMLSFEGAFRVGLSFAIMLTVGQLINYVIVQLIAGQTIMFKYQYVVWPVIACIPIFIIISIIIPRMIIKKMN